jgi:predicted amidohydrolase YtcJ
MLPAGLGAPADGVIHGKALAAARRMVTPFSRGQIKEQLRFALEKARENHLAGVISQDVFDGDYEPVVEAYRELLPEIPLSLTLQSSFVSEEKLRELAAKGWTSGADLAPGSGAKFRMGAIKLYADGSLGSRTALLREPYSDAPDTRGAAAVSAEELAAQAGAAHNLGFQVMIHALGDGGLDNAIAALAPLCAGDNPRRHGIIHAEVAWPDQLERIAALGLLVLTQPAFLTHDISFLPDRLGPERVRRVLPLKSIAALGIRTAYGSDCPVESLNPLEGIKAACTRFGFVSEEAVDEKTAVEAYTLFLV